MSNLIALPNGTELVGDYRITRVLGAGGFGITYQAEEIALARKVTIKEYFPSDFAARAANQQAAPRSQACSGDYTWGLDRFIDEAKTLAKFNHPNIVQVYRYFRANNTGYMVLHFEEGQSLKSWLKKLNRAPRQNELDDIVAKLLNALEVIHNGDFLHRDIAPDNIIIRKDGEPVLIDFGSARGEIAHSTKTVSALVKPGYSPYEQYAETSREQGPWTDIYALGATLYHAVTGKRPADSPSRMVNDQYTSAIETARGAYRANFLRAIDEALHLKINQRPQSIAKWRQRLFADDLEKQRSWLGIQKTPSQKQSAPNAPSQGDDSRTLSRLLAQASADSAKKDVDKAKRVATLEPAQNGAKKKAAKTKKITSNAPTLPSPFRWKKRDNVKNDAKRPAEAKAAAAKKNRKGGKASNNNQARKKSSDGLAAATVIEAPKPTPLRPVAKQSSGQQLVPMRRPPKPVRVRRNSKSGKGKTMRRFAGIAALLALAFGLVQNLPTLTGFARIANSPAEFARTSNITTGSTTRLLLRTVKISEKPVIAAKYSDDGRWLVAATGDNKIHIYWTQGGGHVRSIDLIGGPVTAMALYGRRALTGHDDGHVAIWNLDTSERIAKFHRNDARIWSVAFAGSPDRILTASHDWKVALWDQSSPTLPVHVFDAHESAAQAIAYSPERRTFASGGADKAVKLWDLRTLDTKRTYRRLSDFVTALVFKPGGKQMAAGTLDGRVRIWRTGKRRILRVLKGHRARVTHLAYAPNGRVLASASKDGTIRLWNLKNGRTIRTLASHNGVISTLSFSRDGERIASAGDDGNIRIWSVPQNRRVSQR